MADPQAILRFLRDPNLQTGPYPQWPTMPPMPPSAQLRNPAPRPADAMAPVAEALSPTMGAYGMGQIGADTALKAAQGDYAGVAANMPFIVGALKGPVRIPNPIKAYHGSPHDFNEFSMDKIGTGEGAQAYGHGLYFAENENVAKTYKNDPGPALARAMNPFKDYGPQNPGHMYEVNLHGENFIDWDKSLGQQSPEVQSALEKAIGVPREEFQNDRIKGYTIDDSTSGRELMEAMRQAGIPGIRYLDQQSRAKGQGTHNYSVWSPEIIEILRKYGIIAAPTAGAIANAVAPPPQQ